MFTSVVAKMYVSAVNQSCGIDSPTGVWAHLNAVYSPDKSTENYSFSSATPNASAKVYYRKGEGSWAFSCGEFYRVYFERVEPGKTEDATVLHCNIEPGGGHGGEPSNSVTLNTRRINGADKVTEDIRIQMTINNPHALSFFEQGALYRVNFEATTKDGN